ncbi:MAG: molybdenum cofactor guanylyltransferase [Proteobacteria bacterium]|nr:molybdenum cofactor guanylyltransferase [Pseudomonadota bacterium]
MTLAVILNGGKSSRMGQDKSKLIFKKNSLLDHTKILLKSAGMTQIHISGQAGIKDELADMGPVSGIFSCLNALADNQAIMFIPVDMPLLSPELISYLKCQSGHALIYFEDHYFPILIHNTTQVRKQISNQLKNNHLAVHQLIKTADSKAIHNPFEKKHFFNTNTVEQWQKILDFNKP